MSDSQARTPKAKPSWGPVYLFNAATMPVIGIFVLFEWRHDGSLYHLVAGAIIVLMSPSWIVLWRRERRQRRAADASTD
ncbi:MAG TPA: hypothetical protein VFW19_15385 [Allosphingosinicella sp.]|nr:hypothetical protein [Allosphingosinicella sp.]